MPISPRGEEEKKIIIIPVSPSVIAEETQPKDYNANDDGILVEQVPGKVINVEAEDEKPMGGVITPLIPPSAIFPDGHGHLKYQGAPEMQFNRLFDSYSCVIYTIAKAICYNLRERYNIDITISEMFNAYFAGVRQGVGTTIRAGMESFRTRGWVEDRDYPFTAETTLRQFQQQPPISIINKATGQLTKWKFNWEVVGKDNSSIINALQRTVLVATGFAWASYYGNEGVYFDYNNPANHAFLIADYKENKNIIVDDSYPRDNHYDTDSTKDEFIKELDKSFNFGSMHRVWLEPIVETQTSFIIKFKNMAMQFCRDARGGFHLLKDLKRQKITSFWGLLALLGEILKPRQISDEDLAKNRDVAYTSEHFFPES
jgi:hypothetical protein